MSVRYVDIHRFVRMLISSEITRNYRKLPVAELSQSRDFFFDLMLVSDCCRYQAGNRRWFLRLGDRFRSVWKICEKVEIGGVVGLGDTPCKVRRWYSWTFPRAACEWKSTVCKNPSGSVWKPRGIIQNDSQIIRSMALHPCLQAVEDPSASGW